VQHLIEQMASLKTTSRTLTCIWETVSQHPTRQLWNISRRSKQDL